METFQLDMKKLSIELLQIHDLFAATVKTSLKSEESLIISKAEIVQFCAAIISRSIWLFGILKFNSSGQSSFISVDFFSKESRDEI